MNRNTKKKDKFYITTPIYYASGNLHLGHAYTSVACDVLARWNRNTGKSVFFMTGSDEHGQKVAKKAEESKLKPKEYTDKVVSGFKETMQKLNIDYDYFIRTTDEKHKKFVQKMLQKSYDNGDIFKAKYEGLYCVDCEQYYKEDELIDGKVCHIHKKEVEKMSEENYFFALSKYQDKLLKFYNENPQFLSPKTKSQEIINRVKDGLLDISISRSKKSLSWGIDIPFDNEHVIYVWFDALFNYISGLEINKKTDFWPADVHVVGKDIMWFHKVFWPAFLMSCGYEMPKRVFAHGWWTVNGEKMGKSMGNVIEPIEMCEKYGSDQFRYFLLAVGTFGDDVDFSIEKFAEKINNELNNDFGNLVSRVHAMTQKYFDSKIPFTEKLTQDELDLIKKTDIFQEFDSNMQDLKFNPAIEILLNSIRETNAYINKVSPWKIEDKERLKAVISTLAYCVRIFAEYFDCFIPIATEKIRVQYNFKKENPKFIKIFEDGHKIGEKNNIFEKMKVENPSESRPIEEKQREGFSKLNLKVGKIIEIDNHKEAEKLFVEKIDLGNGEIRQIVSGLKDFYNKEELLGKNVIVVYNLKPAKLRGEISQGMILVSEKEDESNVGLLISEAPVGSNLQIDEKNIADNPNQIKVDEFFKIKMSSDGEKLFYEKKEIYAGKHKIKIDRNIKGNVC